jgi:ABC-type multidrug transport system fused ATPase/permease subunit
MRLINVWPLSLFRESSLARPIKLLPKKDRQILLLAVSITIFLAFLDLLGVLLIGVIGSLSITGLSTAQVGNRVAIILELLGIKDQSFQFQVIIISSFAAILLMAKTLISLFLFRRVLFFMARRSAALSAELISKYFTLSVSRLNKRSAQNSIYALTDGVTTIMISVIGTSVVLISDIALLVIMGVGLFVVDPITAISTILIFSLLALYLYLSMHKRMKFLGEQQGRLKIESAQRIFETISSYRELLVRNRRGYYAKNISSLRYELAEGQATMSFLGSLSKYVLEITLVLSAIVLALYQFSANSAFRAIATITIFIAASTRITPAILRVQQGLLKIKSALAEARPTVTLIEEISNVSSEDLSVPHFSTIHTNFIPRVTVSDISFWYEPNIRVIDQINFEANPGEYVAIVGSSGAGKTTLIDLILGALEGQEGLVTISGLHPKLAFSQWPGAVSYVPQDSPIVNGTIRENLCLGYNINEVPEELCWESMRVARLDEFVSNLPRKLDTIVADRGTSLSGGQRQRLGIARALITRPKLLFLDEATSALDGITEFEISESLKGLKGEITLVVIAHRLSTVVNADRIYFLQKGRVGSVGTFQELKSRNPEFLEQAKLMGL